MNATEFEIWLSARPEETRQCDAAFIAARAAARIFPQIENDDPRRTNESWQRVTEGQLINTARCLLITCTAMIAPRVELRYAALFAVHAEIPGLRSVRLPSSFDAFMTSKRAAQILTISAPNQQLAMTMECISHASLPQESAWVHVSKDIEFLESSSPTSRQALWSVKVPDWFVVADEKLRNYWASDPDHVWDFWARWWDGLVTGRPIDGALQEKVALIPDDIWQQGAAAVARAIKDIEGAIAPPEPSDTNLEKVIEQTRHGAVLFYDPATKLIGEEAVSTLPQDVRRDVIDLMQDVLNGFPAASAANNLYELIRRERDILERAINAYSDRPWMLLTSLRRARGFKTRWRTALVREMTLC